MIVNDSPGEECRIAILQNGHLEELYTERSSTATNVGNIYKGRVVNVEPAIQAAFIDYGEGTNGFLHISDLHPKYFPGEERTERVGKKIPRRERPPIQHALKRGQEILVQVLKEGIGTKGPTLTSYLSIAGRLLVLMPDMDRVGVSRKVEDEQKRREMRDLLDSIDLPEGFGFILRTAGEGKTKTELKRDAAYLMRLWKVMEKRIKSVGAPCELYTESDLFIRTLRDVLRPSIKAVIVDSDSAYERASMLLRVIAPRSTLKVIRYDRPAPIFHAFDVERQIELIHAREVPLSSGGRLVFDQTEALVAIDVNSGRSRSARDSETNAYETNCEAADEICRQLRLRDLGGLIVNDLIDMRSAKHRKAIEQRFQDLMKRDRAKATVLPISQFGIIEMTRQRMRPSIRKSHFMDCPHCNGYGEIKSPDYVGADAVRHVGYLLQFERVKRVEVACSPRVASVLLSGKRRELVRLEDAHAALGKKIDVRVSEAIPVDRVNFYAYDDRNADIDVSQLPALKQPNVDELEKETQAAMADRAAEPVEAPALKDKRKRRRRGGPADATAIALAGDFAAGLDDFEEEEEIAAAAAAAAGKPESLPNGVGPHREGGKRSRRRRGRRRHRGEQPPQSMPQASAVAPPQTEEHPVRIHELARELGVTSRQLIDRAEPEAAIHHVANALASVSAEEAHAIRQMFTDAPQPAVTDGSTAPTPVAADTQPEPHRPAKRSRRRRGRRRGGQKPAPFSPQDHIATPAPEMPAGVGEPFSTPAGLDVSATSTLLLEAPPAESLAGRARRKRRRGRGNKGQQVHAMDTTHQPSTSPEAPSSSAALGDATSTNASRSQESAKPAAQKRPRRALYRAGRVSVSPAAREGASTDD